MLSVPAHANGVTALPPSRRAIDECVHLIDDDPNFLDALAAQCQSAGYSVERYFSAEHFLETYKPRDAECILLDVRMPGMNGLELLSVLDERRCTAPLLVISAYARTPEIVSAIQRGAIDYLVKPIDEVTLLSKVAEAISRDCALKQRCGDLAKRLWTLTAREREVMELLMEAKNTLQIAHHLGISPKTVEKHRAHIFDKLNIDNVPALIRLVCRVERRVR
jgi:two-component system response regulator DctR